MTRRGNVCLLCGEEQAISRFMKHRNDDFENGFGFCKTCVNSYDTKNQDSMIELFRMMNIPFIEEVWEDLSEDGQYDSLLARYLRSVATRREFKGFSDSVYGNKSITKSNDDSEVAKVTEEQLQRWGEGKTLVEYKSLDRAYESLVKIKPISTFQDEKRYVINVQLGLALENAIKDGEIKQIKGLRDSYTKDLKELGLDLGNQDDEEKKIGQRIQEWEKNEPIPTMDEEFQDVDGIKRYLKSFFVNPMKRTFGQATDSEIAEIDNYEVDGESHV